MSKWELQPVLSDREKQILQLLAEGYTADQISQKLFIDYETVKTHRINIKKKLKAINTANLIHRAHRLGVLQKDTI